MCAQRQNKTNGHSAVQSTSLLSSPLAALPPALRELVHGMTDPHTSTCTYHCALSLTDKHFNDLALKNASDVKLFHPQLTHWCVQPRFCTQETAHALCALRLTSSALLLISVEIWLLLRIFSCSLAFFMPFSTRCQSTLM